jgi:putative NADH-flavin reductase
MTREADERGMRVLVFGASGRTGRLVVKESLDRGHRVLAFVRDPAKLDISHPQLTVVQGDVRSGTDVDLAVQRADAVISVIGPIPPGSSGENVCSVGIANIVDSMSKHGVRRLICLSDYGNGETKTRDLYARYLWLTIRAHLEDKERLEEIVKSSSLDWTIVRPTILTDGAKTGSYKVGPEIKIGLYPTISRHDVADFVAKQVTDDSFIRSSPSINDFAIDGKVVVGNLQEGETA